MEAVSTPASNPAEELIARYDAVGDPIGTVRRGHMREHGLWHAAAVVLVRSIDGTQAYVHRRSPDKDVFAGLDDCWAGGVVAAGESPAECAARELAEELGIDGPTPVPLFTYVFNQPPQRCHNFAFEIRWGGAITHQPEEIVSGAWVSLTTLRSWAHDPDSALVPDGALGMREWFSRYG